MHTRTVSKCIRGDLGEVGQGNSSGNAYHMGHAEEDLFLGPRIGLGENKDSGECGSPVLELKKFLEDLRI